MSVSRRQMLGAAGLATAVAAVPRSLHAEQRARVQQRVAAIESNRPQWKGRNTGLAPKEFKIRIRNDFKWDVVFGIFGMRDGFLGYHQNMQWRRRVKAGASYQSGPNKPINGGERIAVIWDEFSEAILDFESVLVDSDLTIEIDSFGDMTIS
jgi:hypothetical protein